MTTRFRVGTLQLDRVVESEFAVLAPAEVYPDCTPDHIARNLSWLAPRFCDPAAGKLILSFQGFVIRSAELIRSRRLARSREDLLDPALASATITGIAFANGFSDATHFSRCFRQAFAVSPR